MLETASVFNNGIIITFLVEGALELNLKASIKNYDLIHIHCRCKKNTMPINHNRQIMTLTMTISNL